MRRSRFAGSNKANFLSFLVFFFITFYFITLRTFPLPQHAIHLVPGADAGVAQSLENSGDNEPSQENDKESEDSVVNGGFGQSDLPIIAGARGIEKPGNDQNQDRERKSELGGKVNNGFQHIEERAEVAGRSFIDIERSGVIDQTAAGH